MRGSPRECLVLIVLAAAGALYPAMSRAQAWLPQKGSFVSGIDYNDTFNTHHYDSHGATGDFGHTRALTATFSAAYSPTDRWMLSATLPWVQAEYHGAFAHPTPVDDGRYHDTVTDLRLEAHYQWISGPFAVAPYVAVVIPTHDYITVGHAAAGRGLNEAWIGTFVGKSLDRWLPRTYVQGRINYAFVERIAGIKHDRINVDAELGYFISPRWSVRAIASWQDTDGGIALPTPISHPHFEHHDQLGATRYLNLGGGVAWRVTDRLGTYAVYSTGIHGQNGHALDRGVSVGLSFGFGP
jgi:hypothetical protein